MRDVRKRCGDQGRRIVPWLLPVSLAAAALTLAGAARAAQIVLETVEAPAAQVGESCPAPCFNVRMFLEDPTRSLEIQSLQFDVAIVAGGTAAKLPVPPASSNQAANGNFGGAPWTLSATVGKSPNEGFDALVVNAAAEFFSVNSVQAQFDAGCDGANCSFIGDGLAANRIYLGRFNATLTGDPSFRIGGIAGDGAVIDELRAFHTPDWVPPQPPPSPPHDPPPSAPPVSAEPTGLPSPPAEDPPVVPSDGPIFIGIACGEGCLDVRPCATAECADLFRGRQVRAAFDTTLGGYLLVLSDAAAPEPVPALLLLPGAALLVLKRTGPGHGLGDLVRIRRAV